MSASSKETKCAKCNRDPKRMNSDIAECAHIECPYRRSAWSERPTGRENYAGPWHDNEDSDPIPIDEVMKGGAS